MYVDFAFCNFDFGTGGHCEHYRNPFRCVMDCPWRWIRIRDTNLLACLVFASQRMGINKVYMFSCLGMCRLILDCSELPSVIIKNNGLTLDLSLGQTI